MKKRLLTLTRYAVCLVVALPCAAQDFDTPVIEKWTVKEKGRDGKEREVGHMSIDGINVHERNPEIQPQPPVVTPGAVAQPDLPTRAPSDATILFDGTSLENWTANDGGATKWLLVDGALSPTKKSGPTRSKQVFGSCQLHVEFATPKNVVGSDQGRGNSGVWLMGQYEIQVLDSYENKTYPDGQSGAVYGRSKPLVNASRPPGEWQSFDIIFHRPKFADGKVVERATFTIFNNGVLIQDHYELSGGTGWRGPHRMSDYVPHADTGPILLQDHGNPVLFRNIWVRELED
jgi:hypothetical protein